MGEREADYNPRCLVELDDLRAAAGVSESAAFAVVPSEDFDAAVEELEAEERLQRAALGVPSSDSDDEGEADDETEDEPYVSPWFGFLQQHRGDSDFAGLPYREVQKRLGAIWRSLPASEREQYGQGLRKK